MEYKFGNQREDPACPETHIQTRAGTIAQAPERIAKSDAVAPLRKAHDDAQKFEREIAERQVLLDAARAAAIAIQDQYTALLNERADLLANISRAESELATSKSRIA